MIQLYFDCVENTFLYIHRNALRNVEKLDISKQMKVQSYTIIIICISTHTSLHNQLKAILFV